MTSNYSGVLPMLNRTILVGRLTKPVELRYTQNGDAVGSFTIAVNRNFKNSQGEREADFINCVIWRKSAEVFNQWTGKGSLVAVDGRLQTRNYQNNQGQTVYVTELVVDEFSFLDSKSDGNTNQQSSGNYRNQMSNNSNRQSNDNQPNFNNNYSNTSHTNFGNANNRFSNNDDPFNNNGIEIKDADLPF